MAEEYYTEVEGRKYRSPIVLWRCFCASFVAAIALYLVLMSTEAITWTLYAGYFQVDQAQADLIDLISMTSGRFALPIFLICAVFTLLLVYRLTANAHATGDHPGLTKPTMAAASFVIPLVTLIMPPMVMGRLWRATFNGGEPRGVIGFWWAAFLTSNFSGLIANANRAATDFAAIRNALAVSVLSFSTRAIAAGLLLFIFATLVQGQKPRLSADVFE
ncbi:MAG: DUF4328 domain-containing protein [Terricaulis sp.]